MKTYLKDLTHEEVIRRLKAGEVVKYHKNNTITKYDSGILYTIHNDRLFSINTGILVNICCPAYFETPDKLKLEVGKCYKTRDGRKAFVFVKDDYNYRGVVVGSTYDYAWREKGKSVYSTDKNDLDLISEWSDDDVAED